MSTIGSVVVPAPDLGTTARAQTAPSPAATPLLKTTPVTEGDRAVSLLGLHLFGNQLVFSKVVHL